MMKEINQIKNNQDNVAMIGTPCQILAASKMEKYHDNIGDFPVDLTIGLFCMENFSYNYMKELLNQYNIDMKDIEECRIEKGYLWFYLTQDKVFKIPLDEAKKCIRKSCQICMDFTSEQSDISVGSVGSPDGWSTIIIRTDKGLELVENAEKDYYIKTQPISDKGLVLMDRLAVEKKNANKLEIKNREKVGRPVISRRFIPDEDFISEVSSCQFKDLKGDVIDIGACVLCGACYWACPEDIIKIEDRKPEIKGECPEGCNACYVACPRTYVSEDIVSKEESERNPFGNYIKIMSAKAPMINGQDGGVATALLSYALANKIVDKVMVVDKSPSEPWKPIPKITDNVADVLKASGTKYAACPIFKSMKNKNDKKDNGGK
ncbi:MAG: Coenzyme F420 hydrogenase/dehydrogenase, beta subunit C-terminal domain [Methanomicrobiales archaeon]